MTVPTRPARLATLCAVAALVLAVFGFPRAARSAGGDDVLFHLDGATNTYTTRTGSGTLTGAATFSDKGRALGPRLPLLTLPKDPRLGAFPYGAFGLFGTDRNGDGDYADAGEVDPVRLMDDMKVDGVYDLALSATLGRNRNEAEITRILEGARAST